MLRLRLQTACYLKRCERACVHSYDCDGDIILHDLMNCSCRRLTDLDLRSVVDRYSACIALVGLCNIAYIGPLAQLEARTDKLSRKLIIGLSSLTLIQESPAIADKPARRESLSKIAPIRRAYNVVADDTGLGLSSFV